MNENKTRKKLNDIIKSYNDRGQDVGYLLELVNNVRNEIIFEYFSNSVNAKLFESLVKRYNSYDDTDIISISDLNSIDYDGHVVFLNNSANAIVSIINTLEMLDVVDNFVDNFMIEKYVKIVTDDDTIVDNCKLVDGLSNSLANLRIKNAVYDLDLNEEELTRTDILKIGNEIATQYENEKYKEIFEKELAKVQKDLEV